MPPEIADSDAESEGLIDEVEADPDPATAAPRLPNNTVSPVSPPKVDFDEFIDPTQRLSDLPLSQDPLLSRGTGSTERILRGLDKARQHLASSLLDGNMNNGSGDGFGSLENSSPLLSRRRGQSAIDIGSSGQEQQSGGKKRAKTYSTKSRNVNTQSTDLFPDVNLSNEHEIAQEMSNESSHESAATSMRPPKAQTVPRERDRPRRVISLLEQSMTDPKHRFSTSTSSMGGYQSINLDFRGSEQGLDMNANPFGGLSQVSVEGEAGLGDMIQHPHLYSNVEQTDTIDPAALQSQDLENEMMTSPARPIDPGNLQPEAASPHDLTQDALQEALSAVARPSKRQKTDMENLRAAAFPTTVESRRAASVSAESVSNLSNASSKKRGGKSKALKVAASSPAPEALAIDPAEPVESYSAMDPPDSRIKRSRRGTQDSSSQVSQISEPVSNTKRKRKKTKTEQLQDQSSPAKHPPSDPHLSNEDLIGLPKEQYKPRRSRSRSKRSVDDKEPVVESPQIERQVDDLAPEPEVEIETPKPPKTKGKGKKSKVKRAKTSGAALKKSEPMLSEGEEDILFMDEKPAVVKLDLLPNVDVFKKEEEKHEVDDVCGEDGIKTGGRAAKHISIEIPAPEELEEQPSAAVPKKRGRKPKNRTPSAPTPEPLTELEDEVPEPTTNANSRAALAETDLNKCAISLTTTGKGKENTAPTPSPVKPPSTTHSPLKSSSTVKTTTRYRVGLSKRQAIPSLLRRVDKTKKAPTKVSTTVKEKKVKAADEGSDDEGGGIARLGLRGKDGQLIEWEF